MVPPPPPALAEAAAAATAAASAAAAAADAHYAGRQAHPPSRSRTPGGRPPGKGAAGQGGLHLTLDGGGTPALGGLWEISMGVSDGAGGGADGASGLEGLSPTLGLSLLEGC